MSKASGTVRKRVGTAELAADTLGTVLVEYVVVLTLVMVGAVGAMVALGPMLLDLFQYQRGILLLPFP